MCPSPASNRAEYSLQQLTIVIALVLGGVTLAGLGLLRSRNIAFAAMPPSVALVSLVGGAAVVAFGVALAFIDPRPSTDRAIDEPRVTLTPSEEEPLDASSEVKGRILDAEGEGVEDVRVELVPLFEGRGAKKRKTDTDSRGRFSFDDVKIDLGSPYVIEAIYDDTRFPSARLRVPRGSDVDVDLTVAPTTTSAKDLSVTVESLAIIGDGSGFQAVHAFEITNGGTRAFVGELKLPLLSGAANIQEGTGVDRRLLELEHGAMRSTKPIPPGEVRVTYTYVAPMSSEGVDLRWDPALPTERYELLISGDLDADRTEALRPSGEVTLDAVRGVERTYRRWIATDVRGDIAARIVVDEGSDALRLGAPIGAAAIALLVIVFGLLRRRRRNPPPEPVVAETTSTPA